MAKEPKENVVIGVKMMKKVCVDEHLLRYLMTADKVRQEDYKTG